MSDSDSDCLSPDNLFNFPKESTMIRLKGPQYERTLSLKEPRLNQLPRNFEKQRLHDGYERRNLTERRLSPGSYRSASDRQPRNEFSTNTMSHRNMPQSYYNEGYAPSFVNGRAGSPTMSMMSMGSNMSVTADVIVSAFKSIKFNKYELRNIKEAYHKLMKGRVRKRITKRRNLKMFLKGARRVSGGESGDQGSDSSLSSDGCRSTRTGVTMHGGYRNYAAQSQYRQNSRTSDDARSVRTDFTDLRKTVRDQNVFRDCSGDLKQNSFRNMFSVAPTQAHNRSLARSRSNISLMAPSHSSTVIASQKPMPRSNFLLPSQRFNKAGVAPITEEPNSATHTQPANRTLKDRFKGSFLLPSQRFNKTSTTVHMREDVENKLMECKDTRPPSPILMCKSFNKKNSRDIVSETDEDMCDATVLEKTVVESVKSQTNRHQRKRSLSSSEESLPALKKVATPHKVATKAKPISRKYNSIANNKPGCMDKEQNDFIFAKPMLPSKKVNSKTVPRNSVQDYQAANNNQNTKTTENKDELNKEKPLDCEETADSTMYTSDMSMRPSFLKRKLFTQTLDVTESKNISNDSLSSSPHTQTNGYLSLQNEKTKTRKLVSSSSYMCREVADDNNLMDLIHKIVPPDQINLTQQKPQSKSKDIKKTNVNDDKWDISSIITTNDVDEGSDTYTNEDIFETTEKDFNVKPKKTEKKASRKGTENSQKIDLNKNKDAVLGKATETKIIGSSKNKKDKERPIAKVKTPEAKSVFHYANMFWNCDSESEGPDTPLRNTRFGKTPTPLKKTPEKRNAACSIPNNNVHKKQDQKTTADSGCATNNLVNEGRRTRLNSSVDNLPTRLPIDTKSKVNDKKNDPKIPLKKEKIKQTDRNKVAENSKPETRKTSKMENNNTIKSYYKPSQAKPTSAPLPTTKPVSVNDTSITPTRKSHRLMNKHNSSSEISMNLSSAKPENVRQASSVKTAKIPPKSKSEAVRSNNKKLNGIETSTLNKSMRVSNKRVTALQSLLNDSSECDLTMDLSRRLRPRNRDTSQGNSSASFNMTTRSRSGNNKEAKGKANSNTLPKRGRGCIKKDLANDSVRSQVNVSNKENESPHYPFRRKNENTFRCCDDTPKKPQKPDKGETKTAYTRKAAPVYKNRNIVSNKKVDQSPMSVKSCFVKCVRDVSRREGRWGLGYSAATVGVLPRHCGLEPPAAAARDDASSVTIRSAASTSFLSRSRRPGFMHVF